MSGRRKRAEWKRDIVQVSKETLGGGALCEAIVTNDARERIVALVVNAEFFPLLTAAPFMLATLRDIVAAEDIPSAVRMARDAIREAVRKEAKG